MQSVHHLPRGWSERVAGSDRSYIRRSFVDGYAYALQLQWYRMTMLVVIQRALSVIVSVAETMEQHRVDPS